MSLENVKFWEKVVKDWEESVSQWEWVNNKYPGDSKIVKNKNEAQRNLDRCKAHLQVVRLLSEGQNA